MTQVHFRLSGPDGVPLAGAVSVVPTRRVHVGDEMRLPAAVCVQLLDGEATVDMMPSQTTWVWRVAELVPGGSTRYVAVPDSGSMVEYADLDSVDPATLDVSSANVAAWEIATRQTQDMLDKVSTVDSQVSSARQAATDAQAALAEARSFDLTVGTVSDLPYGQHATAVIRGVWPSKTVDFQLVQGPQGETGAPGKQGIQGVQGIQGEKGDPFAIAKVYESVASMRADKSDDVKVGQFVMISTGDIDDPENSCLYCRVEGSQPDCWSFVTDMSGAQGVQGPQGVQGIQGPQGDDGERGPAGIAATITVDRQVTVSDTTMGVENTGTPNAAVLHFTLQRGPQGIQGIKGDPGKDGVQLRKTSDFQDAVEQSKEHLDDLVLVLAPDEEASA